MCRPASSARRPPCPSPPRAPALPPRLFDGLGDLHLGMRDRRSRRIVHDQDAQRRFSRCGTVGRRIRRLAGRDRWKRLVPWATDVRHSIDVLRRTGRGDDRRCRGRHVGDAARPNGQYCGDEDRDARRAQSPLEFQASIFEGSGVSKSNFDSAPTRLLRPRSDDSSICVSGGAQSITAASGVRGDVSGSQTRRTRRAGDGPNFSRLRRHRTARFDPPRAGGVTS